MEDFVDGGNFGAAAATKGPRRTILLTAMGTRGDVQPFVALGLHLRDVRGWRVVVAVPPEYRSFVQGYGLEAEDIGISLQHAISSSPQGRALRTAGALNAFQATQEFFRLPLLESWFSSIRRLLAQLRPEVLLLSSFVAMSGSAALPALLGLPTRVVLAYTIPMLPTAEFGMPLAGTGFTAPAGWINKLQWEALQAAVAQPLHMTRAQRIVDEAAAEGVEGLKTSGEAGAGDQRPAATAFGSHGSSSSQRPSSSGPSSGTSSGRSSGASSPQPTWSLASLGLAASPPQAPRPEGTKLGRSLTPGVAPTMYIYSPSLLPKPWDWPSHTHVVGTLLLKRQQAPAGGQKAEAVGLPHELQAYLEAATRSQLPVVYIGLGSMLGTVFEAAEVQRLIGCMQEAVTEVASMLPLCAVIHTTVVPGSSNGIGGGAEPGLQDEAAKQVQESSRLPPTYLLLHVPVPHELLLPQCDLIVHHGGAGTTQAALLAGKPSLIVPCVPSSDQPFWADLVHRRGLGPPWFPVRRLTVAKLAAGIRRGLTNLDRYTAAAEALAYQMAREDGVSAAADIIEQRGEAAVRR